MDGLVRASNAAGLMVRSVRPGEGVNGGADARRSADTECPLYSFNSIAPIRPLGEFLNLFYKAVIAAIAPNITPGKFAIIRGQSFFV